MSKKLPRLGTLRDAGLKGSLILSASHDPAWHCVLEETLLNRAAPDEALLCLWANDPCVVIGKHQNPWLECNLSLMSEQGVPLHRRLSGGGAVYHDLGNLNYSLIAPRAAYNEEEVFQFVIDALAEGGVLAERKGRSGLFVGGKKISGTAFAYRKNHVLHHGTLLVQSDLTLLQELLTPPSLDIKTHAVRSDPAEVVNLSDLNPALTLDSVKSLLIEQWKSVWPDAEGCSLPELDEALLETYRSWEWRYGKTPKFIDSEGCEVVGGCLDGRRYIPLK